MKSSDALSWLRARATSASDTSQHNLVTSFMITQARSCKRGQQQQKGLVTGPIVVLIIEQTVDII